MPTIEELVLLVFCYIALNSNPQITEKVKKYAHHPINVVRNQKGVQAVISRAHLHMPD